MTNFNCHMISCRDKHNLEESVRKLQLAIDQLKDTEATNFSKSQRSRDMIEHTAFERNQAEIEIRRLKVNQELSVTI